MGTTPQPWHHPTLLPRCYGKAREVSVGVYGHGAYPVDRRIIDDLALEATARGIGASELVARLLGAIVSDDLYSAVLDDAA